MERKKSTFGAPSEIDKLEVQKYFGIEENLKSCFSCSLHKGGSGKLYITTNHICFHTTKKGTFSFGSDKKIWDYDSILDVDIYQNKYIRIITVNNKKYLFSSFNESLERINNTLQRSLFGYQGNLAIHNAVEHGNIEKVKQILEISPTKLTICNKNEQTPLHIAIIKNDLEMVKLLLKYYEMHSDICNINEEYGKTKNTILHTLCSMSDVVDDKIYSTIFEFPLLNVEVVNYDLNTPLHYFCERNRSLECKKLGNILISRAKNVQEFVSAINRNKESVMHKAVFNKHVRVFMVDLLIKHQVKLDIRNEYGETPLHYAVRLGRVDICEKLLRAGADPTIKTNNNQTARDIADEYTRDRSSQAALTIVETLKNVENLLGILNRAGLSHLSQTFLSHGLHDPYALIELTKENLENFNIDIKLGPQIKLFKEIELFKKQLEKEEEERREAEERERKRRAMLPPDEEYREDDSQDEEKIRQELGSVEGDWEINGADIEFTKKLGSGANGKVYRGLYKGKEVALKVLTAVDAQDEMEEFKKELLILTSVRSPLIVKFYGASLKPKLTLVMEYCSRGSLYHVLSNKQLDITWDMAINFILQMAEGMAELHEWKPTPIVHRDLKSLNLLVTEDWNIKVCDFGLSRFTSGNNLETFKKLCGTFAYCAPDIFTGNSFTDRSDVFSMGIVIWEVLNRTMKAKYEMPYAEFKFSTDFQIIGQVSQGLRPTIPENSPPQFVELIKDCTAHEPTARPTAEQVAKRIRKIKEEYDKNKEEWDKLLPIYNKSNGQDVVTKVTPKLVNKKE